MKADLLDEIILQAKDAEGRSDDTLLWEAVRLLAAERAALRDVVKSWAPVLWTAGRLVGGGHPYIADKLAAVPAEHRLDCSRSLDLDEALQRLAAKP